MKSRAKTQPSAGDFRRVAWQRLEDAQVLLSAKRTTGAMYLAGYAVECMLKSLVLTSTPKSRRKTILEGFRGIGGHNIEALRAKYRATGAEAFPRTLARSFATVNLWSTDERYNPRLRSLDEARHFMAAVRLVVDWIQARTET